MQYVPPLLITNKSRIRISGTLDRWINVIACPKTLKKNPPTGSSVKLFKYPYSLLEQHAWVVCPHFFASSRTEHSLPLLCLIIFKGFVLIKSENFVFNRFVCLLILCFELLMYPFVYLYSLFLLLLFWGWPVLTFCTWLFCHEISTCKKENISMKFKITASLSNVKFRRRKKKLENSGDRLEELLVCILYEHVK